MSAEFPTGNETSDQAKTAQETDIKKIGYPPKGQKEQLAKIKAAEQAEKKNPDAILAELENQETETARTERLMAFVAENFLDCPEKNLQDATEECQLHEDMSREFISPDYCLTEADIADLKPKVEKFLTNRGREEEIAEIEEEDTEVEKETAEKKPQVQAASATVEAQKSKITENVGEISKTSSKNNELKADVAEQKERAEEGLADEKIIKENYPEPLKSEKNGTIGALNALKDIVNNPKTVEKINQILAKLQNVSKLGTTPEAQNFFQQAVQQSDVDLSASSPNQIYASLISNIDAGLTSGAITQSDANAARISLGVSPKTTSEPYKIPKDSSQMARDLRERRNTEKQVPKIDPATGEPMVDEDGNIIYETITEENNDVIPIDHPSLEIYLKPEPGSDAYDVHILSESRLPLVERIDANNFAMGGMREINYLVATADMEQQGFTDMFGSQFTSNEVRRHNFNNFMRATGMDPDFGSLWTTEHSDRIRQMMQMLHPRGDLGRDDVNPDNWKERATELGVYDQKTDQWDYDALSLWRDSKTFDTVGKDGEALLRSGEVG